MKYLSWHFLRPSGAWDHTELAEPRGQNALSSGLCGFWSLHLPIWGSLWFSFPNKASSDALTYAWGVVPRLSGQALVLGGWPGKQFSTDCLLSFMGSQEIGLHHGAGTLTWSTSCSSQTQGELRPLVHCGFLAYGCILGLSPAQIPSRIHLLSTALVGGESGRRHPSFSLCELLGRSPHVLGRLHATYGWQSQSSLHLYSLKVFKTSALLFQRALSFHVLSCP